MAVVNYALRQCGYAAKVWEANPYKGTPCYSLLDIMCWALEAYATGWSDDKISIGHDIIMYVVEYMRDHPHRIADWDSSVLIDLAAIQPKYRTLLDNKRPTLRL